MPTSRSKNEEIWEFDPSRLSSLRGGLPPDKGMSPNLFGILKLCEFLLHELALLLFLFLLLHKPPVFIFPSLQTVLPSSPLESASPAHFVACPPSSLEDSVSRSLIALVSATHDIVLSHRTSILSAMLLVALVVVLKTIASSIPSA